MSDEQARQKIQQMQHMASNPTVFEIAKNQMKRMNPKDIAKIKEGELPERIDSSKFMENIDGAKMKQMMCMIK